MKTAFILAILTLNNGSIDPVAEFPDGDSCMQSLAVTQLAQVATGAAKTKVLVCIPADSVE